MTTLTGFGLPLTAAQHEVWIGDQLDRSGTEHNCAGFLDIQGPLRVDILAAAVERAVGETDALRTRLAVSDDNPTQGAQSMSAPVQLVDLSGMSGAETAAWQWMRAELATPVDINSDPLFVHVVLRLTEHRHLFYLRYHHIVLDGFGQALYWQRVAQCYTEMLGGTSTQAVASGTLADLVAEDRAYQDSAQLVEDRDYWLSAMADYQHPVSLRQEPTSADVAAVRFQPWVGLGSAQTAAAQFGTHWSVVVLSAVAAYLSRMTGQSDVVLGFPVRARTTRLSLNTPGMLSNVLPLRVAVDGSQDFAVLVKQVAATVSDLLKHQRFRGEQLRRELRAATGVGDFTGVVVNLISFDGDLAFGECTSRVHQLSSGPVRDLAIDVFGGANGSQLSVTFEANPKLHRADGVRAHLDRFLGFFEQTLAAGVGVPVNALQLLAPDERERVLACAAGEHRPYDLEVSLHELVQRQAGRTPDAIAATSSGQSLTYQELESAARQVAGWLRQQGIGRGDVVGVHAERGTLLVVALLGVLMAGGAYLPLDPELPSARLAFQIADSGSRVVLSGTGLIDGLAGSDAVVAAVEDVLSTGPIPDDRPVRTEPTDTAYVIYTSGSTGQPKGVAVPHRAVINRLHWMQDEYQLQPAERVLQKTPFTFDVSVWEFFWPLITGASLHLADPGAHRDPRALAKVIGDEQITTVHFVPSVLDLFLLESASTQLRSLRRVICSGEALRPETVDAFLQKYGNGNGSPALHNLYGPTEAAIDVTYWPCGPAETSVVPIGRPVANTQLYVLDSARELVPFGVAGELFIGGVQVASGYLNRPELTQRSFVANPFGSGRLYRTGDLVVMRPDGVLLYQGRIDDQVKVHGFRIEPGEVASVLQRYPGVTQAVVTAPVGPDGQRQLVGYVVGKQLSGAGELSQWLRSQLPAYMVPGKIIELDEIPLTSSGKVDRQALAARTASTTITSPSARNDLPTSAAERCLAEAWSQVLGIESPSLDDSFFALGGDSMHAIRVRTALEHLGYTFSVFELFENPSIRQLAEVVRPVAADGLATPQEPFALLDRADRAQLPDGIEDAYPISAMQAGMLFHAAHGEDSAVYRVVTSVRINLALDEQALRLAVADTMQRHPSLRCSFDLTGYTEPLQLVHREVEVPVSVEEDLTGLAAAAQIRAVHAWTQQAKYSTFDTSVAPLLAFAVHRLAPAAFELSVVEHHVILDGWSDMRMLEEIVEHYTARREGRRLSMPAVASSYRSFVAAELAIRSDETARRFWHETLAGAESSLIAPAAQEFTAVTASHRYDVEVSTELAQRLRTLAVSESLPLKSLLVAAHLVVLRLVTGQDEVVTGLIANARLEEPGADETIGVFLNTLPLRAALAGQPLIAVARQVFAFEQRAAPYRRYPFAQLQHDLGGDLRLDSYVNYMDFRRERGSLPDGLMSVTVGVAETNYPLAANFLLEPEEGRLQLWLDCGADTVESELAEKLPGYYRRALEAIADDAQSIAGEVNLLDPAERAEIEAWNDTSTEYDGTATLHGLVSEQARLRPDATALTHHDDHLDYAELEVRANRLAHHLRAAGVARGDLVGVSLRRSVGLMVSLLAVLKVGAAYVPMDVGYPISRLRLIAEDAAVSCLITGPGTPEGISDAPRIDLVDQAVAIAAQPEAPVHDEVDASDLAYVIYTSGSTGKPKGTGVRHRSVVNFFRGMQDTVGCTSEDVMLAVTSMSFDISVLELFWPLTCGAKVVLAGENVIANLVAGRDSGDHTLAFSLFFFAASASSSNREGYRLVVEAAKYADTHGFEAVWTPERHLHAFGGLYPNPSVMSAALATVTERIGLRCGSIVAPLHDTVRIAEEWSLVDNLSDGRVGLAFAAGWNSNDFVLRPENFADRKRIMGEQLEEFGRLWRGEPVQRVGGSGEVVDITIFPSPVQQMPPIWLTSVGTVETFQRAGALGANLLTHLLGQDLDELAEKITAYRLARAEAGHEGPGRVTAMVHTYLAEDTDEARRKARAPFANYLRSSTELWRTMFATTNQSFPELNVEEHLDAVIEMAIDRYFESSGLFGSPETCAEIVRRLAEIGVDEAACLVDFGLEPQEVLDGLQWVDRLRRDHETEVAESRHSLSALCQRHGVSMLQGTPSLFTAIAAEPDALRALEPLRCLLIGGESFPSGLAQRLHSALDGVDIFNMYGPTETTIWSSVHKLVVADIDAGVIPIGRPIANTVLRVADANGMRVPVGVSGELWIGGHGVATGYLGRPELTAERFVELDGETFYRTGDRVRWRSDGELEFLGRVDRQVKILGHRIEPDEIESVLSRHPQVDAVAVKALQGANGPELVAYVSPAESASDVEVQQAHVQRWGDAWNSAYVESGVEEGGSDFAGWLSSYTGEPIPETEMTEWLDWTVRRIRCFGADSIADVGVGVGLILRSFAELVSEYHGMDLSSAALRSAARCLGSGRTLPPGVRLVESGPEYLASLDPDSLDLVVINSVAQYFPSLGYLRSVLTDAARVVRPGGTVFVGDVRSLEMLPEFCTSVQVHRAAPLQTADELRSAVNHRLREERELCLSPDFFRQLAGALPGVSDIQVELKRGWADNELTAFRYDVSLLVGGRPEPAPSRKVSFDDLDSGIADLPALLSDPEGLVLTGIPNRRLMPSVAAAAELSALQDEATAWHLHRLLWQVDLDAGVHPEDLHRLAVAAGRNFRTVVATDGRLNTFDAVFGSAGNLDQPATTDLTNTEGALR